MDERPRLRPVEAFPIRHEGKTLICVRDPQHFSQPLVVSGPAYFILSHCDGLHTLIEIQEACRRAVGDAVKGEDIEKIVGLLDAHYYLHGARFLGLQEKILEEFRRLPTRAPAHAGTVYRKDPAELRVQLEGYFRAPEGPGLPEPGRGGPAPKAIVAPHIDFHRGGPGYAWAYKGLAESEGADLFILLGTSHCGGENPFAATLKHFDTPLGSVETEKEFVEKLQQDYAGDLFAEEALHRTEHSLEFQVVFLKYVAEWRARIQGRERPFKIVPILVSSFHPMVRSRTLPEKDEIVGSFLAALRRAIERETRKVCVVAGVDLAHVGMQFGDREPITRDFLGWVEEEDRRLIDRLAALDGEGFFQEIAKDQDRRRICGFSPLYSLIHLLDGSRARHLKYSQAFTQETGSAVTFTSMVFE